MMGTMKAIRNTKPARPGRPKSSELLFLPEAHPQVREVRLEAGFFGLSLTLTLNDGRVRRRYLPLWRPDPNCFRYTSGRFFAECLPYRGRLRFRLVWHGFDKDRDLTLCEDLT